MRTSSFVHRWDVTPHEAVAIQNRLRVFLTLTWDNPSVSRVGGIDCSYARGADKGFAVVVVLGWPRLDEIDMAWTMKPISFPYIPGLLTLFPSP
ncbi:MAG: hypothetical protein A2Y65_07740 [Deltaproteobacteria bacterium RBG_13_52_11]|nr:MAG: hypothetical protein A2Y65_07740 [Deltaproteobacteria bacterium RBG_13_52_11]